MALLADGMTIDEFARATNTSARNVRAYHERGILPPPRMVGRTGFYEEIHLDRMAAIQALQAEGFSLASLRALFDAWEAGASLDDVVGAKHAPVATRSGAIDVSALYPLTKFRRPDARDEHVPRTRPLSLLPGADSPHILLSAPGGSGKSILAAELLKTLPGVGAWVSLDADDDEPSRFWTAVLIAARTSVPDFGDELLGRLVGGGSLDTALIDAADALSARTEPLTVVVDDLHNISGTAVMSQLQWFLTHVSPAQCRLLLCSRTRPQMSTARLAMGGHLVILNTEDLAFDEDETAALLIDRLGVPLAPAEIHTVVAQTDGWPAGIYLTGMALRSGAPATSVLQSLSRPDRQTHEYFSEEVLAFLEPAHVRFLEEIALLERFNADLCDFVRQAADSQRLLDELADNMFVIELDDVGYWKRLHHVFAGVLRARVGASEGLASRHIRTAAWCEEHGHLPAAVHHLVEAGEFQRAARLISKIYPMFLNISNQGAVVSQWLHKLPPDLLTRSPTLSLAMASVAGLRGEQDDMDAWVATVEALSAASEATLTRSLLMFVRGAFNFGEVERALQWACSGFALCPPDDPWAPMQGASLALLRLRVGGPTDEVLSLADQVLSSAHLPDHPIAQAGAWAIKAVVLAERGDRAAGLAAVLRANEIRSRSRLHRVPQSANTWASSARAYRLLGRTDSAAAEAEAGHKIIAGVSAEKDATGAVVPLLIELIHARRAQGRDADARRLAAEVRRRLQGINGPGLMPVWLAEACDGL
ncbi:MerR family transcriptional regulator [Mycolicibacterium confluentis]|uniref:Serine/threonine protein kinase n=2 Tax=Mycolicibacterium confluentis TaxID=28047 RepID=A0A7I7Y1M9_9MYCO|nr:MerR family transcriptional regulator [Mycolicibacterium confluentis]BBZ35497.1 serine/threonine protein kinase [Mycolicibacterium confluentis]